MISTRPAARQDTPLIVGLAGPTRAGKTLSALRLARGLAGPDGRVVMLNAEGPRGHQYADRFTYYAGELAAPFRPQQYIDGIQHAVAAAPSVLIIDSLSHMHDGPGGVLEWHEEELDRLAGGDEKRRERATFSAWVKPKAAVNAFIYALLEVSIPVILCMRATEKLRARKGKEPEFYWAPVVTERISYETLFTLMLPPNARGVPDLSLSAMREPFETMVSEKEPIDEALGQRLREWARGAAAVPEREFQHQPYPPAGTMVSSLPPGMTPLDDALAILGTATTPLDRQATWRDITRRLWPTLSPADQKRALTCNAEVQKRVGG